MALGGGIEDLALRQRRQKQANGAAGGRSPVGRSGSGQGNRRGRPLGQRGDKHCHGGIAESGGRRLAGALSSPSAPVPASLTPLRFIAIWRTITRLWRRFAVAGGAVKLTG